jgi:hypothetical protein
MLALAMHRSSPWTWLRRGLLLLLGLFWTIPAAGACLLAFASLASNDLRQARKLALVSAAAGLWCGVLSLLGMTLAPRVVLLGALPIVPGVLATVITLFRGRGD